MIEIRLLGAQSIQADGHEVLSVSAQPKRLALLAYLALSSDSGDGFVSRDELLALFWPESDDEHARNTLNQHLYRLRGSLGSDAIPSHGANRVGADPEEVRCDVVEFRRALDDEEPERALGLYAGELLPGFHLSGTPDLEKWLDNLRLDLQRRALDAALRLAGKSEAAGDRTAAVDWYRKAHEISPTSEAAERGLAAVSASPPDGITTEGGRAGAGAPPFAHEHEPSSTGRQTSLHAPNDSRRHDRSLLPSGAALVVTALAIGGWWATSSRERLPDPEPRLAVLPFDNLTGDSAADHLVDLMHDQAIREAGEAGGLLVISRTSVLAYRDSATALPDIGRGLGADAIVEGTVRAFGDSLQVHVRLLDAASERTLWTRQYVAERMDSGYVTLRVPWLIANEVRRTLNPEARLDLEPPYRPAAGAVAAYVRGREQLALGSSEGIDAAIEEFDRAVELDPRFSKAWAALGRAWETAGGWFGDKSPVEAMPEAQNAYERALAIDSTLADAHGGIATIEWRFRWRWSAAERAFRRSIELNPNLAETRDHYGNFLRSMRRIEEGVVQLEKAVELDPLGISWAELRQHYQHLGRFHDARQAAERAKDLHPEHPAARFVYAIELWEDGARRAAADTIVAAGGGALAAMMYAEMGDEDRAREQIAVEEESRNRDPLFLAYAYMSLHDTTAAVGWLNRGIEERHASMVWLGIAQTRDDRYELMIEDFPEIYFTGPRFEAIMDRLNFPEPPFVATAAARWTTATSRYELYRVACRRGPVSRWGPSRARCTRARCS